MEQIREGDDRSDYEIKIEENLYAVVDEELICSVLENLLRNAFKFSKNSHPAVIHFGRIPDQQNSFFVKDNGVGFEMIYYDKLFQVFQRLHSAVEYPGTGIGLVLCRRIIERHGGRIWAKASPGAGATFFFSLPA